MKIKIINFLESNFYISLIFLYSLLMWSSQFFVSANNLLNILLILYLPLAAVFMLILFFIDNSKYTIPIVLAMLFSFSYVDINIDTVNHISLGFITILFLILGILVFLIKNRVKIKLNTLGFSFILICLSFFIPLSYRPINEASILIPGISIIYLVLYLFYSNTIQSNFTSYLMRIFCLASLLLLAQLSFLFINAILVNNSLTALLSINVDAPGWGNINDLTIQLVLFSSGWIYFLLKQPKKLLFYLVIFLIYSFIIISLSRGSIITYTVLLIILITYLMKKHLRTSLYNLFITSTFFFILLLVFLPIFQSAIISLYNQTHGSTINEISNSRIIIWQEAFRVFRDFPVFGASWYTDVFFLNPDQNRITVFHSTFFQVLATGGLFGIFVLGFHWYKVATIFKSSKHFLISHIFLVVFILTQLHGLFDNTQYMLVYTVTTLFMFVCLEKLTIHNKDNSNLIDTFKA